MQSSDPSRAFLGNSTWDKIETVTVRYERTGGGIRPWAASVYPEPTGAAVTTYGFHAGVPVTDSNFMQLNGHGYPDAESAQGACDSALEHLHALRALSRWTP